MMLMEDLSRNVIKGLQTDLILLDFSKAFNNTSREKLLLQLHHCGARWQVLHWIKAFLSNRSQTVVLENRNQDSNIRSTTRLCVRPNLIFGLHR